MEVQKNAIISIFQEVMTDFNTRLDCVAADVQDLKCSKTFQCDKLKELITSTWKLTKLKRFK